MPLHSPLLRQSLLVSFPPLIDMLKFSGYPCLIGGQSRWVDRPATGDAERGLHCARGHQPPSLPWEPAAREAGEAHHQAVLEGCNDAPTGMPPGVPRGAMCVQRFDDSLKSAIRITSRISLRSSSMPEPRDPSLKVFVFYRHAQTARSRVGLVGPLTGLLARRSNRVGTQGWESRAQGPRSVMILPQVHLRKPCYDFYFL